MPPARSSGLIFLGNHSSRGGVDVDTGENGMTRHDPRHDRRFDRVESVVDWKLPVAIIFAAAVVVGGLW
jgi:hypothetical protein